MDEMQNYELEVILKELEYTYKNEWEQTRFISYITAQTQSTKHLSPTDLISFDWDSKDDDKKDVMTKEDVERLTKKMNDLLKENKLN